MQRKSQQHSPEFTNFLKKNISIDTNLKAGLERIDHKKREQTLAYLRACYSRLYQVNC